jgi:TraY domain
MARKERKVGRPPGTQKEPEPVVAARLSPKTRELLVAEARRNKRTLSREIAARLDYTLGRYQKLKVEGRPPHIMALSDTVAVAARVMEETTGRPWNRDQYTSQHLARLIRAVMADFTQPGEVTIPPKVIEEAKRHPAGDAYPTHLGEDKAKGIIALIRLTPDWQWWGPNYPDVVLEVGKIRRDLEPKRRK